MNRFEKTFVKPKERKYHGLYPPTDEQWEYHDGIWRRSGNIAGIAVAGSGKTSIVIQVMWTGEGKNIKIAYLVFSKDMEMSMKGRVPEKSVVKTCHAFGRQPLAKKCPKIDVQSGGYGKKSLNQMIIAHLSPDLNLDRASKENYADVKDRIQDTCKLIDMIRANMVDWNDSNAVAYIADYYGINIDIFDQVVELLPKIFQEIIEKGLQGVIDFTSMYWLPVYLDLPMVQNFDILLVDEYQDLNECQRQFVKKLAGDATIGIVGDPNQSIFGFAGATPNSMGLGIKDLNAEKYGITYNFRCGRKIVESVQHIVPQIKAWHGAGEGELINVMEDDFDYCSMPDDCLALSRVNSRLVRPAFQRIKKGKRANIKGRDLKYGLDTIHRKVLKKAGENPSIPMLIGTASDMEQTEMDALTVRKNVSQSLIELTKDRYETFRIVCEQVDRPEDIKPQIKDLFDPKKGGVVFSSMHRSKGLEADEVYIIGAERMTLNHPEMKDWEHQQENNLVYVAQTRAKNKLVKIFKEKK